MKIINHNGKPCVEGNVFMLPTDDEPTNGLQPISVYSKPITKGGITCPLSGAEARRLVKMGCQAYHLYITTEGEIKKGDWYMLGNLVRQALGNLGKPDEGKFLKIIATTDPKLTPSGTTDFGAEQGILMMPQPSQSFIEDYCKAGGIDKVLVEVEYTGKGKWITGEWTKIYKPKLNPDNTITIHPVEEKMYSRKEVGELIKKFYYKDLTDIINSDIGGGIDKWIEENL